MVTPDEIAQVAVFAALSEAERERLARAAADISLAAGEYAANKGDERALFAVLEGRIEAVRTEDGIPEVVGVREPGDIFGEFPVSFGTFFPVGFRASEPSRVMRIEPPAYYATVATAPDVAREVGRLALYRSSGPHGLAGLAAERNAPRATVLGRRGDAACTELRRFLDRNQISFTWLQPDAQDADELWGEPLPAERDHPAIRLLDGTTVPRPPLRRVA